MIFLNKNNFYRLLLLIFSIAYSVKGLAVECIDEISLHDKKQNVINTNLVGIGVVTAWGIVNWDYFTNSPKSGSEDWFQNDTKSGGADKLGHLYTTYVATHGLSALYESWCFNRDDAALYGALSSMAIMGYMEVGDSFSDFGFSNEDMLANGIGSLLGYYLYVNPDLANKVDIRWEYGFHPNQNDLVTDYENIKYLVALKLNGFEYFQDNFLKHIELQLGYYSRGFDEPIATKERNLFFAVGLNLTDLFRRQGYKKTATLLRYVQIPGANMEFSKDKNK